MHPFAIFAITLAVAASTLAVPIAEGQSAVEKRFIGGSCGVHVRTNQNLDDSRVAADVSVYDGKQQLIWKKTGIWADSAPFVVEASGNGMPQTLSISVTQGDNIASFEYGQDFWFSGGAGSQNDRCKVGKWDRPNPWSAHQTVDLDCGFSC